MKFRDNDSLSILFLISSTMKSTQLRMLFTTCELTNSIAGSPNQVIYCLMQNLLWFFHCSEDKRKKFVEDIQSAAKESLEKYFILNKAAELLGLQLDWENSTGELAVEKKLYAFFNDKG